MFSFDPSQVKAENHPKYPRWKYVAALPSPELMGTIGAPDIENFLIVGESWAQVITKFLRPGDAVLDIGCGCGRTARFLIYFPDIRYIGFDIFNPSIEWCVSALVPLNRTFEFHHFDGISEWYNPRGSLTLRQYRFPADTGSINMAIGASIFTHLKELDATHYLEETHRVLTEGGKAILSIHINPVDGKSFSGNEDRIDINPQYFILMSEKAGLQLKEPIGDLCGQETFLFEKPYLRKRWFRIRRKL
jgi:SAM-dependent methyltransferase